MGLLYLMILWELMLEEGEASPLTSFTICVILGNLTNQCAFCLLFNTFESTFHKHLLPSRGQTPWWQGLGFFLPKQNGQLGARNQGREDGRYIIFASQHLPCHHFCVGDHHLFTEILCPHLPRGPCLANPFPHYSQPDPHKMWFWRVTPLC